MKILICGLPGTGKTTLSKMISENYHYFLISDWDIFYQNRISIKDYEDKNKISEKYSNLLIKSLNKDNLVADLEYSISPNDFVKSKLDNVLIVYLGFVSVDEETLFNLFRKSKSNDKYTDKELKEQIKFYKEMSLDYKSQCEQNNLKFFDVNTDRKIIFEEILQKIKTF